MWILGENPLDFWYIYIYILRGYLFFTLLKMSKKIYRNILTNEIIEEGYKPIFDQEGFDQYGYDKNGIDRRGFNMEGIHNETKDYFDLDGLDEWQFDREGINHHELLEWRNAILNRGECKKTDNLFNVPRERCRISSTGIDKITKERKNPVRDVFFDYCKLILNDYFSDVEEILQERDRVSKRIWEENEKLDNLKKEKDWKEKKLEELKKELYKENQNKQKEREKLEEEKEKLEKEQWRPTRIGLKNKKSPKKVREQLKTISKKISETYTLENQLKIETIQSTLKTINNDIKRAEEEKKNLEKMLKVYKSWGEKLEILASKDVEAMINIIEKEKKLNMGKDKVYFSLKSNYFQFQQ